VHRSVTATTLFFRALSSCRTHKAVDIPEKYIDFNHSMNKGLKVRQRVGFMVLFNESVSTVTHLSVKNFCQSPNRMGVTTGFVKQFCSYV